MTNHFSCRTLVVSTFDNAGDESTQPKAMPPFYPSITAKESIEKDASSSKVVKAVNIVLSCSDKIVPMKYKLELMT